MDIHRCRFVNFPTSAISALAFSRSSDSGYKDPLPALRLVIGRANGSIEIWNPLNGSWVQESVCPGDGKSIDGLVWTQDIDDTDLEGHIIRGQQRLFSIASSPAVTEWDLVTGLPKRKSTGNFSEVWCFAAQPRLSVLKKTTEEPYSQDIIAGCGDGTLVLLSTAENDLQFKRFLARVSGKKARCMCVTYQNRNIVVAGFADSMIRIYETRNGSLVRNMSLGVGIPGAPKTILVWQVRCLPNGDILSGDSNGEVRFWDGRNYSLLQRLHGHDSDCLDLVTSNDGKMVFSGSIDGKLAIFKQASNDSRRKSWAKSSHRRVHYGEVKAMAAFDGKNMSVVVSGGSDVAPMVTPLRSFGKENLRSLSSLPQDPPVASSPRARLLVSWWEKTISIWRIVGRPSFPVTNAHSMNPHKLVGRISLDTRQVLRSVSISEDGKLLAASTSAEVKIFQLKLRLHSETLAIRKVELLSDFADLGARLLSFSPNGKWLAVVTPDSEVHVVRFAPDQTRPKLLRCISRTVELDRQHHKVLHLGGLKDYDRNISRLAFGTNSSVLVTGDQCGYIDSWVLEGHEDLSVPAVDVTTRDSMRGCSNVDSDDASGSSDGDEDDAVVLFYGQHWTDNPNGRLLPKLDSAPLILTFRPQTQNMHEQRLVNGNPGVHATRHNPHAHSHELPGGQHRLWVMTARHQMYEFDVLAGKLSEWSKRNPTAVLPVEFTQIRDRAVGAVWDVTDAHERLWLYGSSWVFMLNVGSDLDDGTVAQSKKLSAKRKQGYEDEDEDPRKRRKGESGAGGPVDTMPAGSEGSVKRFENGKWSHVRPDDHSRHKDDEDSNDDDDDGDAGLSFMRLRSGSDEPETRKSQRRGSRKWWYSFRYRPILGMVPLDSGPRTDPETPLEVALVERPLWEARELRNM